MLTTHSSPVFPFPCLRNSPLRAEHQYRTLCQLRCLVLIQEKHLHVCLNLDQSDGLLNLKLGTFCNTTGIFFYSHMKVKEAQAQESSCLLIFLLEDLLGDLLSFLGLFPMVDNKAVELVQ